MPNPRLKQRIAAGSLVLLAACAGGDDGSPVTPDPNTTPATVIVHPGADTLDWVSATRQMSASVLNGTGGTLATQVTWSSSDTAVVRVSASGMATGLRVGTSTLRASAGGIVGESELMVRQVPATVEKVSGDGQTAAVQAELPEPLIVEVRDGGGTPIPGAELDWRMLLGSGSLSSVATEANGDGRGQARWTLGTEPGNQQVEVRSGTAAVVFDATSEAVTAASVSLAPSSATLNAVGDTIRFVATVLDTSGDLIHNAQLVYTSTDTSVATIDSVGLATGRSPGTASIIVQVDAESDTASIVVHEDTPENPPTITAISPAVLIEGDAATITGSGFSADAAANRVTVDGLAANVTSASSTSLTIEVPFADCLPPRKVSVEVTGSRGEARQEVRVSPMTQSQLELPVFYYRFTYAGNGCLHLPESVGAGEYLIGVASTSQVPSSLTAVTLRGTAGERGILDAVTSMGPAEPLGETRFELRGRRTAQRTALGSRAERPSARVGGLSDRHAAGAEIVARNLDLVSRLGRSTLSGAVPDLIGGAVAGDTVSVWSGYARTCTTGEQVRAVIRLIGDNAIWLDDVENPAGTFTDSELGQLDSFYANHVQGVHDAYFGSASDVDSNGRTVVLMTKEVNRQDDLGGWVWWGDLYPSGQCGRSNQAEIFFGKVPDPGGSFGDPSTKEDLLAFYPSLLAHETTHIIQAAAIVLGSAGNKTLWEIEGGASLAEQLVAYSVFGHGSGRELGYSEYEVGAYWYWNLI
ncbi:MAG: Ig-like domain-containing protein [Dehalococcoidia bacterium]